MRLISTSTSLTFDIIDLGSFAQDLFARQIEIHISHAYIQDRRRWKFHVRSHGFLSQTVQASFQVYLQAQGLLKAILLPTTLNFFSPNSPRIYRQYFALKTVFSRFQRIWNTSDSWFPRIRSMSDRYGSSSTQTHYILLYILWSMSTQIKFNCVAASWFIAFTQAYSSSIVRPSLKCWPQCNLTRIIIIISNTLLKTV